jgi:hypothetical protein
MMDTKRPLRVVGVYLYQGHTIQGPPHIRGIHVQNTCADLDS